MKNEEVKSKLGSIAESVRANKLYDLTFELDGLEFFKLKVKNDCNEKTKLSNAIYKYNQYGS
jgi:hypothetical protein